MRPLRRSAFTLTEMLVVISILAIVVAIASPALLKLRHNGLVTKDLTNIRNLQLAHQLYMFDHNLHFVDMSLAHAAGTTDLSVVPWIKELEEHFETPLAVRSPLDRSPHWPSDQGGQGLPLPVAQLDGYQFRRTSYGCNAFLSWSLAASPDYAITGDTAFIYSRLTKVKHPAATVDFLLMAESGPYAGSDHVHPETWAQAGIEHAPELAAEQVHTAAAGGQPRSATARSNYGFLDGHAETRLFAGVYLNPDHNAFDPAKVAGFLQLHSENP